MTSAETMSRWTLQELADAAGADIHGATDKAARTFAAVGTDSRKLPADCLFIALRGETFDGHNFVASAIEHGARAVLVDKVGAAALGTLPVPSLVVADTLQALGNIAHWVRQSMGKPVAAVTGSNGKTTTKELLAAILATRSAVHKTEGNLNNLIGVPLTILRWPSSTWAAVIEMGMNVPGEIARLAQIAQPNVGLVTCVAPAHLEGLGTIEAVARAKAELYAGLPEDATAVLNADDAVIVAAAQPVLGKRRVLTFGRQANTDVQLLQCTPKPTGLDFTLRIEGTQCAISMPLVGQHNAMNAAGAAAAAWALGLSREAIAQGLAKVAVPGARSRVVRHAGLGISVLDDTYNANPGSMKAAFATLRDLAGAANTIAVLGDMFELGTTAPQLHHGVGQAAAAAGIPCVLAVGPLSAHTAQGARDRGGEGLAFDNIEALYADLHKRLNAGTWVLVKGSRGMRMERVVDLIVGGRA